jgi:acrylyl-CoA reductase (NADPH)
MAPLTMRNTAWQRLATDLDRQKLAKMVEETDLDGVITAGKKIIEGGVRGRLVVKIR